MGWRTVVVTKNCKLSYKNGYLVIRSEEIQTIHLSEISSIIVENGMASITSYLMNELANNKIKLIICDEKHNPSCELMPYYGSFNTAKKIAKQSKWTNERKGIAWQNLIKHKIHNQAMLLKKIEISGYEKLLEYEADVQFFDKTNREGHSAKVYFNLLFGLDFKRNNDDNINKALDYGYSILLSIFNREIVNKGYITPLGIQHKNEFNQYNFSCDLMEQFRPLIDEIVFNNKKCQFNKEFKYKLINVANRIITINGKQQFLNNAIPIFIANIAEFLENKEESEKLIFNYEF
ncbi:MAG TPA: type II CRISPR-associated endonuclease Cas1 [Clostridiaceae bacterium]|nr:type II CRISPR-associated endonuclease Cas1 [Clostridiaceae bacterium]